MLNGKHKYSIITQLSEDIWADGSIATDTGNSGISSQRQQVHSGYISLPAH